MEKSIEKQKILLVAVLIGFSCFLTYYFHVTLNVGTLFSHFFYVPIILSCIWWQRKGIAVAILLALVLDVSHIVFRDLVATYNDYFRSVMFVAIGVVVSLLSEKLIKSEKELKKTVEHLRDVTRQKQIEEELRKTQEQYRLLVNNIPGIVYKGYKDWGIEFFDEKIELLTGYAVDEFNYGKMKWIDIVFDEDIAAARESFIQALKTDKSYIREYRIITNTGGILWIQDTGQIICNKKGEIKYISGICFDISDQKQMQEELLKAKKLESIGILAGGIAHDFNNLLYIIMGNIELAQDSIALETGASESLKEAKKASIQAHSLIKQLIVFSKGGTPVKKTGSIRTLLKETADLAISKSSIRCNFTIPHDLWPVEFDEEQIRHAVSSLITNAVESMPDGGTINVGAENFSITLEQDLPLPAGKYIKICIQDHGIGIPEENLSRIFDPYFSTKELGAQKGMGLGLSTAYAIFKRHGGHITVDSQLGAGTTFTLFLPVYEKTGQDERKTDNGSISGPSRNDYQYNCQ